MIYTNGSANQHIYTCLAKPTDELSPDEKLGHLHVDAYETLRYHIMSLYPRFSFCPDFRGQWMLNHHKNGI